MTVSTIPTPPLKPISDLPKVLYDLQVAINADLALKSNRDNPYFGVSATYGTATINYLTFTRQDAYSVRVAFNDTASTRQYYDLDMSTTGKISTASCTPTTFTGNLSLSSAVTGSIITNPANAAQGIKIQKAGQYRVTMNAQTGTDATNYYLMCMKGAAFGSGVQVGATLQGRNIDTTDSMSFIVDFAVNDIVYFNVSSGSIRNLANTCLFVIDKL